MRFAHNHTFSVKSRVKNCRLPRPEKSRGPGILQNPVPEIPGLKILHPAGACPSLISLKFVCDDDDDVWSVVIILMFIIALSVEKIDDCGRQ